MKVKSIIIFFLFMATLWVNNSFSQISDVSFDQIFLEDGLSQSIVKSIVQDKNGFMYFGTEDGLNIYDAYSFKVLRNSDNPNSLSYNDITSLCEDKYGRLWVGTFNSGLNLYIPETKTFLRFSYESENQNSLSDNNINSIVVDNENRVWVGTDLGLTQIITSSSNSSKFTINRGIKDSAGNISLQNVKVLSLLFDKNHLIWVGTTAGLIRLKENKSQNSYSKTLFVNDQKTTTSVSNNIVRSIYEDNGGDIWIGTDFGLNKISHVEKGEKNPKIINYFHNDYNNSTLSSNEVYAIAEDVNGMIWVGTNGGGVNIYNKQKDHFVSYVHDPLDKRSISSNSIRALYLDRSGIMWIGTYGSGINKVSRGTGQFYHYKHRQNDTNALNHPIIWSFFQGEDSVLWIGTHNGLDRLNRKTNEYKHYISSLNKNSISHNVVRVITPSNEGNLLIGTDGGGVNILNTKTDYITRLMNNPNDSNSLANNQIRTIYQDQENIIWIGTYGSGLDRYNPKTGDFKHFVHIPNETSSISHNYVRVIIEDGEGHLWIGTEGGGLNKFDKSTEKFVCFKSDKQNPNSLSSDYIFSIYNDHDEFLWLGTYGGGISKFNLVTTTCETFTIENGLPSNSVYGIIKDSNNHFWISTNNGISNFSPSQNTFRNFTIRDGLQNNEFNGGSYYVSKSGELFFGGINGFNAFYPENIKPNDYLPPVVYTSFKVFNQEVNFSKPLTSISEIVLQHSDNVFSIEFAALDYSAPEKNKYAYMLEGVDKGWVFVGAKQRLASYTTLSPGEYKFYLKGTNGDGLWSDKEPILTIRIIPPFWQSFWFLGLALLFFLGIAYYLYLRRLKVLRMKVELQTAHDAQLSIMPLSDPENDSLEISGSCFPAYEVGGDFFDYFWLDNNQNKFGAMIGDVSGKAMKAAITAIMTSGMIISETKGNNSISNILMNVNEALLEKIEKRMFVSLCICSINTQEKILSIANAGMNKPILVTKEKFEFLDADGPRLPLGLVNNVEYLETDYKLNSGDIIILTTDGISEAQDSKRQLFGADRLESHILSLDINTLTTAEIKNSIIDEVKKFTKSHKQSDDLTVLVIRII